MKTKQWITEIIIFLLAALFLYTAVDKLLDFKQFIQQINNQPFNNNLTPVLVHVLPASEILLTMLLLWPKTSLAGLYGAAGLLTVFTTYIALVTFNFYDRVPCGCATAFEHLSWPVHLVINSSFLILSVTGICLQQSRRLKTP
ncbi:MauE/DoxX family redox-associated membrane protein [Pedobacter hartonius]|uniref:Methylamine utilisation protein MauE n=1 Tax=Pedobacter hartonius TaxID=425514 RepID=A0A1H4G8D2_9SPHI|nr:MauE/DoxX family redox-associated membrane protein [Pedobacter hartonius]SEB04952.1 Methylamine utilisation protein MauE [Pedobacter hartonius]